MGKDLEFMQLALLQAQHALRSGEVPVGAVLTLDERVIAQGFNSPIASSDPCAHAEIAVLRRAGTIVGNYRLTGATLYVTLEPCLMCAGALVAARVGRLVYGAEDPKNGAVSSLYRILEDKRLNHSVRVTSGVLAQECGEILSSFFRQKRIKSRDALG